jgi:hypothetical protein
VSQRYIDLAGLLWRCIYFSLHKQVYHHNDENASFLGVNFDEICKFHQNDVLLPGHHIEGVTMTYEGIRQATQQKRKHGKETHR